MKQKFHRIASLMCAAALIISLAGCTGGKSTDAEQSTTNTAYAGQTLTVQVTAVNSSTIMANPGEFQQSKSGDASSSGSTSAPPAAPSGDANGPGAAFTASGEPITFDIPNGAAITVQSGSSAAVADIEVNSILQVTFSDSGEVTAVVIMEQPTMGGFGGSAEVTNGTSANTISSDTSVSGESYTSSGDDENALRVDGAAVTLDKIKVKKSGGDSSNTENGDFYGQNAGLLALNGATVTITGATVNTSAVNGNGVFSYGEGTTVNISDSTIRTTERNSGGIQTTGGGTTNASNLDVETQGASSAAIRTDRGGGTVRVNGGSYVTNGTGSPSIYSTADIEVTGATLTANASEAVVVEGKNSVSLTNCSVTGNMSGTYAQDNSENIHNVMIYQSMSGDADEGLASFSMTSGSLTSKNGDMFYVTNTACTISLSGVTLTPTNDTLLRVAGNDSSRGWGTAGANGGTCTFTASDQTMSGAIIVDDISSLAMTLSGSSTYTGTINASGTAGAVSVTLQNGAKWSLTGDSYITSFSGDVSSIISNGYHVYVNDTAID
ncbi:MAG: hypothetical protein VB086_08680 [Clostridiaceae bacterium]|nr:hypothetical protein [Clostridiaceae bacterium]